MLKSRRGTLGVLALQGDYAAHQSFLRRLGFQVRAIRRAAELDSLEGLVLPGGESSAMLRLMAPEQLLGRLTHLIAEGMPVLATCAGVILLAKRVVPEQESMGVLDIDVCRNAYGRQLHSSVEELRMMSDGAGVHQGVFIRAPRIVRWGADVELLACRDEDPVLVRRGNILASTFHPELADDPWVHQLWIENFE